MNEQNIPLMRAEKLVKRYEQSEDSVLKSASFSIHASENVALLGASGSGKSTFLHCLGLLDRPESGEIFWKGDSLSFLNEEDRARFRLEKLGFIFQFHHLIPELTSLENIQLPQALLGKKDQNWAEFLLDNVGLKDKFHRYPWQLSGGEQQRVALARALSNKPELLLTDEATGNLDFARSMEILDLLLKVSSETRVAIVSVTHDENLAQRYQRQYRLKDGRIWDSLGQIVGVGA